jgi:hypothetical protein
MKKIVISFGVLLLLLVVVLAFNMNMEGFDRETPADYCRTCCMSGKDTCDPLNNCKC